MLLTLARSSPQLKVPSPSEDPTPVVPEPGYVPDPEPTPQPGRPATRSRPASRCPIPSPARRSIRRPPRPAGRRRSERLRAGARATQRATGRRLTPARYSASMPRSIWTGAISFGLVTVPVKLYSAVSRKSVRFHQLNKETGVRIQQKRVDPTTGDEVPLRGHRQGLRADARSLRRSSSPASSRRSIRRRRSPSRSRTSSPTTRSTRSTSTTRTTSRPDPAAPSPTSCSSRR